MDRRSWPWKKKSSDKAVTAADSVNAPVLAEVPATEENYKKPSYVQISVESYTHLSGLEDQVKSYEEQVQKMNSQIIELNEKLSSAEDEIVNKEGLVKQHAKVAEEAISGWEKAEAEALTLKTQLEAVMLEKHKAEDRALHTDSALKECTRQIINLKEEHEQELRDVIFSQTKQFEKLKLELESKMAKLDQELLKSEAENVALARSLQERSNMLIKISEQKSQAEAEIEHLKGNIESCEREIGTLKYELHIAAKELEIRTEEKNMSVRSADVANRQHLEAAKKITKLEAECQRLRGLVRKKLPGPAALAQMKLEVESLGDYGDNRRRSSGRTSSSHSPFPDFQLEESHKLRKDNEFLTERLLAVEEDMKMLKEALAKRNSELRDSRDLCDTISSKLHSLEAGTQTDCKNKRKLANAQSMTSMSEDGNEYAPSSAESWSTGLHFDLPQSKHGKSESANHLDLMDDFLEMEKLAHDDSNSILSNSHSTRYTSSEKIGGDKMETTAINPMSDLQHGLNPMESKTSSDVELNQLPLMKLQSRISMLYEYMSEESDGVSVLNDMRSIVNDAHDSLHHLSSCCELTKIHCSDASSERQICPENAGMTTVKEISLSPDSKPASENTQSITQELAAHIYQIHNFVASLGKAAEAVRVPSPDGDGLVEKVKEFSAKFSGPLFEKTSVVEFVSDLSHILHRADELRFNFLGLKENDAGTNGSDCIDKVALPGHELVTEDIMGKTDCGSDPEVSGSSNPLPGVELKSTSYMCSVEDFERMKTEKENLETDLAKCSKDLENAQSQLSETEGKLSELKSQLGSAQQSNSLVETQLKCMVESYRTLERRAEELQTEVNLLREKEKNVEDELQEEKIKHQDALEKCNDLQEQLQRNSVNSECAVPDADRKTNQEKELAAAAEKLAECQETIFLLGWQLKSLRPYPEPITSPQQDISQVSSPAKDGSNLTFENILDLDRAKMEAAASSGIIYRTGNESPLTDMYNALYTPSDSEANNYLRSPISSKHQKHKSAHSLPSAYAAHTPEKHSRGISRFFSTKSKF